MLITIYSVGKLKKGPENDIFKRYFDMASVSGRNLHFGPFQLIEFSESKLKSVDDRRSHEADLIKGKLKDNTYLIALDENGDQFTSSQLSDYLLLRRDKGSKSISFIIGGPDGLCPKLKAKANLLLSLSNFTLPHGLARIILCEQIYRSLTIISGHPYHRS